MVSSLCEKFYESGDRLKPAKSDRVNFRPVVLAIVNPWPLGIFSDRIRDIQTPDRVTSRSRALPSTYK